MEIGKLLKEARNKNSYTQEEIAEILGVSRQSISNWENGRTYPDIGSIIKLSDLYGLSLDQMLKEDKDIVKHLENESKLARSNRKLIVLFIAIIVLMVGFFILSVFHMEGGILFRLFLSGALILAWLIFMEIIERI